MGFKKIKYSGKAAKCSSNDCKTPRFKLLLFHLCESKVFFFFKIVVIIFLFRSFSLTCTVLLLSWSRPPNTFDLDNVLVSACRRHPPQQAGKIPLLKPGWTLRHRPPPGPLPQQPRARVSSHRHRLATLDGKKKKKKCSDLPSKRFPSDNPSSPPFRRSARRSERPPLGGRVYMFQRQPAECMRRKKLDVSHALGRSRQRVKQTQKKDRCLRIKFYRGGVKKKKKRGNFLCIKCSRWTNGSAEHLWSCDLDSWADITLRWSVFVLVMFLLLLQC